MRMSPYVRHSKKEFDYSSMPTVHVIGECEFGTAVGRDNNVSKAKVLMQKDRNYRRLGGLKNTVIKSWPK